MAHRFFDNKNKDAEVKSAGINIDVLRPYVAKQVIGILKLKNIKIIDEKSQLINPSLIKWADKIIISADNVSPELFPSEKVIQWDIPDASEHNSSAVLVSMNMIEKNVKRLVKKLEN